MRSRMRVTAVVILLLAGEGLADCGLVNGSFEQDEWIRDVTVQDPNAWDVDMPAGKFRGYVLSDWVTDGQYNLTVQSEWFVPFVAGETATVSQELVLTDTGQILFDLKLETLGSAAWDPNVCTAVVLLDDDVVWESSFADSDIRGEYRDQAVLVDRRYRDGQPHDLSLGLRIHDDGMLFERYVTHWDFIQCTSVCGGGGLLAGDFNGDCFVAAEDMLLMAGIWLGDAGPESPYNLSDIDNELYGDIVNFYDFAVFADNWRGSSLVQTE